MRKVIHEELNDNHNETLTSDKNDSIQHKNLVLTPSVNMTMNTDTLSVISIVTDTNLVALEKAIRLLDQLIMVSENIIENISKNTKMK